MNIVPTKRKSVSKQNTAFAVRILTRFMQRFFSRALEQPFGTPQQDRRHQYIDRDARVIRNEHLAESVDESDQKRRCERAPNGADAADNNDDETDDQHLRTHAWID